MKKFNLIPICFIVLTFVTIVLGLSVSAYADTSTLSHIELFNATNTYNVNTNNFDDAGNIETTINNSYANTYQYVFSYDMLTKNNNMVSDTAQITVLTHGLRSKSGYGHNIEKI